MKYNDLPEHWKRKAEEMEVNYIQQSLEEIAMQNEQDCTDVVKLEDESVQELLEVHRYKVERDINSGKEKLVRAFEEE